ncbi:MAG: lamin tail domain-containing protein, partial [Actinomycetota bacterium]|nr:lamin tail domain-containing protein [Actinomycetota bacterium]
MHTPADRNAAVPVAHQRRRGRIAALALTTAFTMSMGSLIAAPAFANVDGTGVVINEAYLSGGSAGAAFKNKFIELYNPTDKDVVLDGMSLQYRAAGSSGASHGVVALTGTIKAGGYFLVQASSNGAAGAALPAPDQTSTLAPSGTTGTIALVQGAKAVTLPVGNAAGADGIVDLLGYGGSNTFEGTLASAPAGNTDVKSLNRADGKDTDDNGADFALSATITPTAS